MSKISSAAALPASVVFATSAVNCNVSVFCCFLSPLSGVIFAFFFRYCSWRVGSGPDRDGSFLLPFLFLFAFQLHIYLRMLELLERSQKHIFRSEWTLLFSPFLRSSSLQWAYGQFYGALTGLQNAACELRHIVRVVWHQVLFIVTHGLTKSSAIFFFLSFQNAR